MKPIKSINIRDLFVKGELATLYKLFERKEFKKVDHPWILAMLCLMGKIEEAHTLQNKQQENSFDYFFLMMALTRKGEYQKAKNYLKKLYRLNDKNNPQTLFFYHQAMAFYAFFHSRYRISLSFAKRSHLNSILLEESFWKILSLDMLGHNQIQMGNIYQGIYHLEEAQSLAKILGNKAFEQATSISLLSYKSQFSKSPLSDIQIIQNKIKKISQTDNYSIGLLTLTLAHLYLLVGQMSKADIALVKAQKIIFGNNISRHISSWHFEKAYFYYLETRLELSLSELSLALEHIDQRTDLRLHLKILGLKRKIMNVLGQNNEELNKMVVSLTRKIGDPSSVNKLAREGLMSFEESQDPVKNLFDHFNSSIWENSLSEMIDLGYFGLLREKVQTQKEPYLILGLWKNGALLISKNEVQTIPQGMSELILKALLLINSKAKVSKAELLESIWGYKYDPTRHDTMIFTLIHRLRQVLGSFAANIIGEDHHYRLIQHFKVLSLEIPLSESMSGEIFHSPFSSQHSLNIRQHRCLSLMKKGTSWQVSDYAQEFQVTHMTALRDLTELLKLELITKFGRARATTYAIKE